MKRFVVVFALSAFAVVVIGEGMFSQKQFQAHAQGRGRGMSPEQQAARAKQETLEKSTPQLQVSEEVLRLVIPGHTIGEAVGVAKKSKGHLFVYSRTGASGPARGQVAAELFEFDPQLKFVKQWGPDNYAASFAHVVRVDK